MVSDDKEAPHWSLDIYRDYLRGVSPPEGRFDPEDAWEHVYDVFPVYGKLDVTGQAWSARHKGALRIRRTPLAQEGAVRLEVTSEVTFLDFEPLPTRSQRTTARVRCLADTLSTPVAWELQSTAHNAEGNARAMSELRESGSLYDGTLEFSNGDRSRTVQVVGEVTSNWSLFDAVHRLPCDERASFEFVMLEDLRLPRRGQSLAWAGRTEISMRGSAVRLHGYRQVGEGVLPLHYWLDEEGRLLLVLGNVRAYIWKGAATAINRGDQTA